MRSIYYRSSVNEVMRSLDPFMVSILAAPRNQFDIVKGGRGEGYRINGYPSEFIARDDGSPQALVVLCGHALLVITKAIMRVVWENKERVDWRQFSMILTAHR
jgi:hypothetical protein